MNCPHCNGDWDAGDAYQVLLLRSKDPEDYYFQRTPNQIMEIANGYGYTKENPIRFNRVIELHKNNAYLDKVQTDEVAAWQCPDCKYIFIEDPTLETKMTEIYLLFSLRDSAPIAAYSDKEMAEEAVYRFNNNNVFYKIIPFYSKGH
jgi:Zn-finger nucleic acid-binding protein